MALDGAAIKAKFRNTIHNGLRRVMSEAIGKGVDYPPVADPFWDKLADAISDIAMDLVDEIHSNAEVVPGQQVTGKASNASTEGPVVAETASPGKIK